MTLYDTTCSIRIQGNHEEQVRYTTMVLIPYLEEQVSKNAKQSKTYNDRMIAYKVSQITPEAAATIQHQVAELEVVGAPQGPSLIDNQVDGPAGRSLAASSPTNLLEVQQGKASQGLDTPNANPVVPAPQPHLGRSPPPPPPTYPEVEVLLMKGAAAAEESKKEDSVLVEDDENQKKIPDSSMKVKVVVEADEEIETIEEEFVCALCDKSFTSMNELSPHEKEHGDLTLVGLMRKIIILEALVSKLSKAAPPPLCSAALTHILSSPSPPSFAAVTANSQPKNVEKTKKFQPAPRPRGKIDIQLIADSISSNIVGPIIEKATGSLLHTTKAYAAQADEVAKFQNKVVTKVVRRQQRPVHTAILGAASVDITNQTTSSGTQDENVVTTVASSHSIIESAEFLIKSGKAKQVIVLEHTPRYDDEVKANLAILANKTLHTARNESEVAENIFVGSHTGLEVNGEERRRRFTNDGSNSHSKHVKLGANDQLHMYSQTGALAITKSLTNILAQVGLVKERIPSTQIASFPTSTRPYDWQEHPPQRGFQPQIRARIQNQSAVFQIPTFNRYQGFW